MGQGGAQPSNRTIIGVAILLFSSVLLGVGMHHVVTTGTCSSTGYSAHYGPVPKCPAGTGWWIGFIMVGIWGGVIGGFMGGAATVGLIIGAVFSGIGIGALSVLFDAHTSSSTKVFVIPFGGIFGLIGVFTLGATVLAALSSVSGSSRRPVRTPLRMPARTPTVVTNAFSTLTGSNAQPSPPKPPAADPLDQVAQLAKLHEQGVLTDEEFAREKGKLLSS